MRNLLLKSVLVIVSNKGIPSSFINRRNEFSSHFANTFKVLNVIGHRYFDFFDFDISGHADHRFPDAISIRYEMFQRPM